MGQMYYVCMLNNGQAYHMRVPNNIFNITTLNNFLQNVVCDRLKIQLNQIPYYGIINMPYANSYEFMEL